MAKKQEVTVSSLVEPVAIVEPTKPIVVSLDLKECLELLKGIKLILDSLKKVLADGKIGWDDAAVALDLAQQYKVLVDAVEGFNYIDDELKKLNEAEYIQLALAVFPLLKELKEVILSIKGKK